MNDSPAGFEPLDPGRIDSQSDDELRYWSTELRCTRAELLQAVSRIGNHVAAVREYLGLHRRGPSERHGL